MTVEEAILILSSMPKHMSLVSAGTWWPVSSIREDSYLGTDTLKVCVVDSVYPQSGDSKPSSQLVDEIARVCAVRERWKLSEAGIHAHPLLNRMRIAIERGKAAVSSDNAIEIAAVLEDLRRFSDV